MKDQENKLKPIDLSKPAYCSPEMMRDMKAMCQGRWGGDWSKTFARWDIENEALRPKN